MKHIFKIKISKSVCNRLIRRLSGNNKKHALSNFSLELKDIHIIRTKDEINAMVERLSCTHAIGFDTEWRPMDMKNGPHLIQFATLDRAYLIPLQSSTQVNIFREPLHQILSLPTCVKVGFDLSNDHRLIKSKLNIDVVNSADLASTLRVPGEKNVIGVKRALKYFFREDFVKNKSVTMSNWAKNIDTYTTNQLTYAANDAHAALRVFFAWQEQVKSGKFKGISTFRRGPVHYVTPLDHWAALQEKV